MFQIRAAPASNCLIGGCVWDGAGSGAHVFSVPPQLIDSVPFTTQWASSHHDGISLPQLATAANTAHPHHPASNLAPLASCIELITLVDHAVKNATLAESRKLKQRCD